MEWLLKHGGGSRATVFSDSLSAIQSLQSLGSTSQPTSLNELLLAVDKLDPPPTFVWIPSNVGVLGNEMADKLAKQGTARAEVDTHLPLETKEEFVNIDEYTHRQWQEEYSASKSGSNYRALEPQVSSKAKYLTPNRMKENVITRLRLGKCSLNKYLHDIKRHPDGLCETCRVPETSQHLLLECQSNGFTERLTSCCSGLELQPTLVNILSTPLLQDLVFDLISATKRTI